MATQTQRAAAIAATRAAHELLGQLSEGDTVTVGTAAGMTVTRALHHPDGTGAWESCGVTASYGSGGYSVFVSAAAIGEGYQTLTRTAQAAGSGQ
jgi:hypothetical protein